MATINVSMGAAMPIKSISAPIAAPKHVQDMAAQTRAVNDAIARLRAPQNNPVPGPPATFIPVVVSGVFTLAVWSGIAFIGVKVIKSLRKGK